MAWKWDPKLLEASKMAELKVKQAIREGFLEAGFIQNEEGVWYKPQTK